MRPVQKLVPRIGGKGLFFFFAVVFITLEAANWQGSAKGILDMFRGTLLSKWKLTKQQCLPKHNLQCQLLKHIAEHHIWVLPEGPSRSESADC